MPITISGSGTISGINVDGLPDGCIATADIAAGAVTQAKRSEDLTLASAVTAGSTLVDITGIPSWARRVTLMFNGVSTNGTSNIEVRLGTSSGIEASGYGGTVFVSQGGAVGTANFSSGFAVDTTTTAADVRSGVVVLSLVGSNVWAGAGNVGLVNSARYSTFAGTKQVGATLDRLRITMVNGTDQFDAGAFNILYE